MQIKFVCKQTNIFNVSLKYIELSHDENAISIPPNVEASAAMGGSRLQKIASWSRTTSFTSDGEFTTIHNFCPSQTL